MKKIILATTALVSVAFAGNALAQESQMMSAMGNDISIGGYYEFSYQDYSDDADANHLGDTNSFSGDAELFINFASVSDAGLEYGVGLELEIVNGQSDATDEDNNIDEASIYIAGDFGRVVLGHNDHGGDSFQTWIGTDRTYGQDDAPGPRFEDAIGFTNEDGTLATTAEEIAAAQSAVLIAIGDGDASGGPRAPSDGTAVSVKPHTVNAPYGDNAKITYLSPSFSGFQFGVSLEDDGVSDDDVTSVGAKYDFNLYGVDVTLKAAGYSYANDDSSTSYGATFGYSDFTFTAASAEFEEGSSEPEVLGFGLGYDINEDLFVSAYYATSEDDFTNQELSTTSVGATYTIAHGLTATAALNSFELEQKERTGDNPRDALKNEGEELVLQVEFAF